MSRNASFFAPAALVCSFFASAALQAEDVKPAMQESLDARFSEYAAIAQEIWELAELGYLEEKSSALLQREAAAAGFQVQSPVAGIPTAFVASYGHGKPVIGIMAEFDALPGLSQKAIPEKAPCEPGGTGHGCGHNLFGTASLAAAVAVKEQIASGRLKGTVRLYGTPAEEGGSGKVYMGRAGLYDGVDVMLHWHPRSENNASPYSTNANKSAKFRFHGIASHAASAPEKGRSALDGVEAMNHMANMMREHVPEASRIHYVITSGGEAPNVVPEFAEVFYYIRHPDVDTVRELFERLVRTAEGAALGTETRMEYEVIHGNYSVLPNEALAHVVDKNLRIVGGVHYSEDEQAFAETLYKTLVQPSRPLGSEKEIQECELAAKRGSTDVGDVSWLVPTAGLGTATWVPGTSAHTWQATATGGMSIGHKGMINAAKVMAMTVADLMADPDLIESARAEWQDRRGDDFQYRPLLGDRDPPLDYRK